MNPWWQTWAQVVAQALAERWSKYQRERLANRDTNSEGRFLIDEPKTSISDSKSDQESAPLE